VIEAVLVLAVALFIMAPYSVGAVTARVQAVYGVVGHPATAAGGSKDAIVTVYGEKVFIAHVEGRTMRSVQVRNFSDLKDVRVSRKEIGRLHW
jgi:hypothetical protein